MPFSTAAAPFYCWRVMWPSRETRKNVTSDAWYRRSLPPPFLTCYVIYHVGMQRVYGSAHTRFVDPAWFRPGYLALLASHLLLAIAIVPMVLMTVYHAIRGNFEKHRKIARWDLALLDVCIGHRRGDLPASLPYLSPDAGGGCLIQRCCSRARFP